MTRAPLRLTVVLVATSALGSACDSPGAGGQGGRADDGAGSRTFEFDFRDGSSQHGFEVIYRDIPVVIHDEYQRRRAEGLDLGPTAPIEGLLDVPEADAADRTHWLMNNGMFPLPDGLDGFGLLVQGNNHSDDMDMFIVREMGPDDGIEPDTGYEVTFVQNERAADAPLGAAGAGGSPDLNISGMVTATDPFTFRIPEGTDHIRHAQGVFGNRVVGLGTTAVCLHAGSPVSIPGLERCPKTGRIPFERQALKPSSVSRKTTVTSDADGRFWVMVGGHSGFESFSAYFHTFLSFSVTKIDAP